MTMVGAYFGNDPDDLGSFEAWLGRDVDNVLFYLNDWSWKDFDSSIAWAVDLWKPSGTPVIWSVPIVVSGSTLEEAAAGAFDAHYLKAATAIAESRTDFGPIYVRVGWEFNGSWMPWSAQGHEDAFIAAFRAVVDTFRSVSDGFKFVWDVNLGGTYDPAKAYPGDDYVDVIGMDFYSNKQWDPADPLAAFQSKVDQPYGLQWQQDFAQVHGKQTAISEWGVNTDDMGAYVEAAARWFAKHDMVYQNYWASDYANYDGRLQDGSKPNVGEAFRDAFGHGADDTSPPDIEPLSTLVVRVAQDAYEGEAQFVFSVDGAQIGGIHTVHASHAAGAYEDIILTGDVSDASLLSFQFVNDLYHGTPEQDRNLYIKQVSLDGHTMSGDSLINYAGWNGDGEAKLFNNGAAVLPIGERSANSLTLTVAADAYGGDAQFVVVVDGRQIGGVHGTHAAFAAGERETVTVSGDFGRNPGEIRIDFINDLNGGAPEADRNLYVDKMTINGTEVLGSAGQNGAGWSDATTARMYSDGSLLFTQAQGDWHI